MNKKTIGFIVIVLLITIRAQAQSPKGLRFKVSYQTNFWSGIRDIRLFANPMTDYVVVFLPSMGTGISVGWSMDWFYMDFTVAANYGVSVWGNVRYNQKFDQITTLNMGFKCWRSENLGLDVTTGVGYGVTTFYFVNRINQYSESITTGSLVVPIAAVLWFGNMLYERHRFGISAEFMIPIAPIGHSFKTGYLRSYSSVDIYPSTLSVGMKYQF